ncbi:uncharacterized protein LOC116211296 [Punica granatum]|uniref:J domain-containing protein n=2 Tax=Punica granatum TaxID=22663 RepID=A0A218WU64_PUNGR|nr:uncharacterized protein LOC116211296 [Punica granatum]OWM76397.1 hypothetical protein CDL15_Pgr028267 [Punica granatum]PKI58605.1 hypothetical protein CRG98_020994 [Punica granatum]
MLIPRWRHLIPIKNSLVASTPAAAQSAGFHSTPFACQKWKYKWDSDPVKGQQPTKNYIRYTTRQKRADAKKALKDLLFRSGSSRFSFQDEDPIWKLDGTEADQSHSGGKTARAKYSSRHAAKNHYKKMKRKIRRESFTEDFEGHPETIFHATFGNRWYTWSFNSEQSSTFENPAFGFEWRERGSSRNQRASRWESISDVESDDEEEISIGSSSDRTILGLPPRGPLKLEDVKSAFRLSALRWHPDKHQGPSQSVAEEKFKSCVNAYKSLCSALSAA